MTLSIAETFPIASQTTQNDKLCLLGIRDLIGAHADEYHYLEIGSYLGGSLTPFLLDAKCRSILSVDERGRVLPDDRGINVDYGGITHETMRANLRNAGLPTDKIETFDGSVHHLGNREATFDIAFIDGEHTDEACFRDFIWTLPLMKADSVVAFHDSAYVYKALKLILIYLDREVRPYRFFKRTDSGVSVLLLGRFCDADVAGYLGEAEPLDTFFAEAEAGRILSQVRHRMQMRFQPSKLLSLRLPVSISIGPPRTVSGTCL